MKKTLLPGLAMLLWGCQEAGVVLHSGTMVQLAPRLADAQGHYPAQVDSVHVKLTVGSAVVKDTICPWNLKRLPGVQVPVGEHFDLLLQGRVADDPANFWRWSGRDTGTTSALDEEVRVDTLRVDTLGTPVLSAPSGIYPSSFSVAVAQRDASGSLGFTTDGTDPRAASAGQVLNVPIAAPTALRVRAFRSLADGTLLCSPMVEGRYQISATVPARPAVKIDSPRASGGYTVHFVPPSGAVAQVFDEAQSAFLDQDSLAVNASMRVRVRSKLKNDTLASSDTLCTFEVVSSAGVTPAVLFSQAGGVYHSSQTIAMSCALPNATITYQINGGAKTVYSAPVLISMSEYKNRLVTITATAKAPDRASLSLLSQLGLRLEP
jgi:hypothetical protein